MTPAEETKFFGSPQSCPVIKDTEIETMIANNEDLKQIMAEIFDINIELGKVKQEIELADPAELESEINEQTKQFMIAAGIGRSIEEINAKGRKDPTGVDGGRRKPRHYKKSRRSKVM